MRAKYKLAAEEEETARDQHLRRHHERSNETPEQDGNAGFQLPFRSSTRDALHRLGQKRGLQETV